MSKYDWIIAAIIVATMAVAVVLFGAARPPADVASNAPDYLRSTYSPLHFRPAAELASDAECLACHREVLDDRVLAKSPAGLEARNSLAWYQRVSTYTGDQETFHRRHLTTPLAKQLMNLQCNTCHQGHDPREEAPGSSATGPGPDDAALTLRKQVNPETVCLKCHGQMPVQEIMGLPGPWPEVKESFQNDCLVCHANQRTNRHNVSYLNGEAIEAAALAGKETKTGGDVCHGCHGGRAWYRIAYPYPRHPWPGMPAASPDWAKDRPGYSEPRFAKPSSPVNR
jgi:phosphotransferase system HPr-like phosphotransfer protein